MPSIWRIEEEFDNYYKGFEFVNHEDRNDFRCPFPDDARVSNECDELIKRGHEIFFILSFLQTKIQEKEVHNGINIRRYFCSKLLL